MAATTTSVREAVQRVAAPGQAAFGERYRKSRAATEQTIKGEGLAGTAWFLAYSEQTCSLAQLLAVMVGGSISRPALCTKSFAATSACSSVHTHIPTPPRPAPPLRLPADATGRAEYLAGTAVGATAQGPQVAATVASGAQEGAQHWAQATRQAAGDTAEAAREAAEVGGLAMVQQQIVKV